MSTVYRVLLFKPEKGKCLPFSGNTTVRIAVHGPYSRSWSVPPFTVRTAVHDPYRRSRSVPSSRSVTPCTVRTAVHGPCRRSRSVPPCTVRTAVQYRPWHAKYNEVNIYQNNEQDDICHHHHNITNVECRPREKILYSRKQFSTAVQGQQFNRSDNLKSIG